ncbi:uncharacterized protein LOC106415688 isoform X3 [Brassica napus]|uniref:uncharacterized protein LOC106415688 isoform X3 n=1 Tax=Brassica napus TaxID=3708 RepID=UPI002079A526|nr:uncharacterized protein LOC106415688 isoform X3 [Brassica napus]
MVRSVLSSLSSTAISFSIKTTEFQRPTTRRLTGRVLEKCSWNLTFQLKRYSVFFRVFWIERAGCDDECVILVTATESPDDMKSMAVEAILLLQEKINDDDEETVKMQLLVPSRVIGCVIGRSGSVNASIRISKGNNDDLVERRETWESSLGMVSSDRFYGYESSFPARDRGLVSVSPYSYGGV